MALVDELREGMAIALDTDAIIYYVEENPTYLRIVEPVMLALREGTIRVHVSAITLLEVLVKPLRDGQGTLADAFKKILREADGITLHPVTARLAEQAAAVRAATGIEVADDSGRDSYGQRLCVSSHEQQRRLSASPRARHKGCQ